jgi:transitional endoplasmic reticulum ATPase
MAKAVANESKANFISIKGPEVLSKWVGESEKAVREIFKKAKQVTPAIVFLDELDAIAPRRGLSGDSRVIERVVNQMLTSIDGLESLEGVVVIAATNRPDMIDPALLRTGRFDRLIQIPPPISEERLEVFKVHTKDMPLKNVSIEDLAKRTEGYSGADIEGLCREAGILALREDIDANQVTIQHFNAALEIVRPSLDEATIKFYEEIGKEMAGGLSKRQKDDIGLGYYR